jgi:hypothetical protein
MIRRTQEGVRLLSSMLRSPRAVHVNIAIMRVFVRLRETLALHKELAHRLVELERKIEGHDTSIRTLFDAIRELAAPPGKGGGIVSLRSSRGDEALKYGLRKAELEPRHLGCYETGGCRMLPASGCFDWPRSFQNRRQKSS